MRVKILALYGKRCCLCGFSDPRALQLDHLVPPVEKKNEYARGGTGLYIAILKGKRSQSDFQLLCANCNWIKRHVNEEARPNNVSVAKRAESIFADSKPNADSEEETGYGSHRPPVS